MKQPEYIEGTKAAENFEEAIKAIFKAPKAAVVRAKKKRQKKASSLCKPKNSDKD